MGKVKRKGILIYFILVLAVVLLNVVAWNSKAFCDVYIAYVFPLWVTTYGRLTGLFSFSVGEWLIVTGLLLVFLAVLFLPLWGVLRLVADTSAKDRLRKFFGGYYKFFAWTLLTVSFVMTLNCFILYHASTFSAKHFQYSEGEYTLEEVVTLRNYVVEHCNRLSLEVQRGADGRVDYPGSMAATGEPVDMEDKARETMERLGETYPRLAGYYPRPKAMMFSDFMCQQYMQGYYFPFSMEANYNDVMNSMRKPATMCHELSHLRGYIFEDEANLISYLACIGSDDIYFQYSGYLSVLNYLDNDVYYAKRDHREQYDRVTAEIPLVPIEPIVRLDNEFVSDEEWERINGKALVDTETVDELSDVFVDTTLKINGVSDGMISYSRVVQLLAQYYRENDL